METDPGIRRLPRPTVGNAKQTKKVHATVDQYTYWVLSRLAGIKGRDETDVAYYVIRDWIREHRDELEKLGIEVQVRSGRLVIDHAAESA